MLNESRFRIRHQRLILQKSRVLALISIKVTNQVSLLRVMFRFFCKWKIESIVEKRALDRRQQMFVINNAKLDI